MKSFLDSALKLSAIVVILVGTTGVYANPQVTLDTNSYSDVYGGGEFTALGTGLSTASYSSSALMNGGFETFCQAYSEEFVPGQTYSYTLGNSILSDTKGGASIPLSLGTAYLYSQFAQGILTGYDYNLSGAGGDFSSRQAAATALQIALWWAEGENVGGAHNQGAPNGSGTLGASGYNASNVFENMIVTKFGLTGALAASNGADGVQLLILTNDNPHDGSTPYAQPQLYYSNVPDGGTTALLLGAALIGLAAVGRGARKKA